LSTGTTHLGHKRVELVLGSAADARLLTAVAETVVVAPGLTNLAIGTVASHVSSLTTDTAYDASREVLLLRAVVLTMTDLTAVLASLVLVVTKGTVEGGELTELVALEFVLAFGDRGSLELLVWNVRRNMFGVTYSLNDVVDELLGLVDLLLGVGHDQAMKVFLLIASVSCIRAPFTLLD
jgi:hypothetical protein